MFTAKAEDLSAALSLILTSAERKTTIPILSHVLFESDGEILRATGTDIDTFVSLVVPATSEAESFCVPMKQLFDLVSLMDGDVKITADDQVVIKSGKSTYRLAKMSKEDFPVIETAKESSGEINGTLLSEMLNAASIAASLSPYDTPISKSILLAAKEGKLKIVGCDQKRLAVAEIKHDGEFNAAIPLRAALSLAAFAEQSENVEILCSNNLLTLKGENGEAGARLLAVQWPNWEMIIPKESKHSIELNPDSLIPAIRRATLTTDSELKGLKFTLSKTEAVIITTAHNKGSGQESFPIDCPSLNGDDLIIGIPGRQLLDLFKVCKGAAIWDVDSPLKQVRFKAKDPLAFEFQYIVMPIRVDAL